MSELTPVVPVVPIVEGETKPIGDIKPNIVTAPGADELTKKATEVALKKWKLKIDDKEEEVDEKTLVEYAQKVKAADKRFQEAASSKKEAESFFQLVRQAADDPELLEKIFEHPAMGNKKFRDLAESYLYKKIQYDEMDPKEKEHLEAKTRLKAYEDAEKEAELAKQKEAESTIHAENQKAITNDIITALDSANLSKDEETIRKVAYYMYLDMQNGKQPSAKAAIEQVKEKTIRDIKTLFGHESTTAEAMVSLLGDVVVDKIRKFDISKLNKTPPPVKVKQKNNDEDNGVKPKNYIRERMRKAPPYGEQI